MEIKEIGKIENNYELKQRYKLRSQKFTIFLLCYILGAFIIIASLIISYLNKSIDVTQVLLAVTYSIFGLAGITISGKTLQNIQDAKNIYGVKKDEKMDK